MSPYVSNVYAATGAIVYKSSSFEVSILFAYASQLDRKGVIMKKTYLCYH